MPLIGYARVSTEDQTTQPQTDALTAAGCAEIHHEHASGANRARPVLARVLDRIGRGDTLVGTSKNCPDRAAGIEGRGHSASEV